jgi:hypothetical protein
VLGEQAHAAQACEQRGDVGVTVNADSCRDLPVARSGTPEQVAQAVTRAMRSGVAQHAGDLHVPARVLSCA